MAVIVLAIAAALVPFLHIATAPAADVRLAGRTVRVTVADTAWRRTWGLQGRLSLGDGAGMLFVFEAPRTVTFARKSLTFPVDVVFVSADGRVMGVATLDAGHPTAASPGPARWVVEVPGGWAARAGLRVGSHMEMPPDRSEGRAPRSSARGAVLKHRTGPSDVSTRTAAVAAEDAPHAARLHTIRSLATAAVLCPGPSPRRREDL